MYVEFNEGVHTHERGGRRRRRRRREITVKQIIPYTDLLLVKLYTIHLGMKEVPKTYFHKWVHPQTTFCPAGRFVSQIQRENTQGCSCR